MDELFGQLVSLTFIVTIGLFLNWLYPIANNWWMKVTGQDVAEKAEQEKKAGEAKKKEPTWRENAEQKANAPVSCLTKGLAAKQGVGTSDLHRTMTFPQAQHVYDIVAESLLNANARGRIPVSALQGYDIFEICRAHKLQIANEFLLLVGRDDFEQRFAEGVELYDRIPLHLTMVVVPDNELDATVPRHVFDFQDRRFLSEETPSSFAAFCRTLGAQNPIYWQQVYTRLNLEYTSTSPRGNLPIEP